MNILALDMATVTGWATLIDGRIESGVQDFTKRRGESNGMLFLRFNAWLDKLAYGIIETHTVETILPQVISANTRFKPFDFIVYERAHHRGGAATEIGVGLMTRAQEFAVSIGAEYMAVHTASLKKFATGSGRASKDDMVAYATRQSGRLIEDDNEADAIALLYFGMNEVGI